MNSGGDAPRSSSPATSADHIVRAASPESNPTSQVPFVASDSPSPDPGTLSASLSTVEGASADQLAKDFHSSVELQGGDAIAVNLDSSAEGTGGYSDTVTGIGDAAGTNEDVQDWLPEGDHELKRVKVYELIGSRWVDQGTAFCFGQFQMETNEALLIARSETNCQEVILSTAIRSNDVYQRQQDTLIVWTEPDGVDYALSFQDPEGCAEVWNFILEVQRHLNATEDQGLAASSSPQASSDQTSITPSTIIRSGHLPMPQLGIITDIDRAIKALARTLPVKDRICEYIQQENYIKSLINVMIQAEDLESLENLHALCGLMQTILMLNDHNMYEHILEDSIFFGVVGMLEYDPEFPLHKANYREFLHQSSHFHQPIPIRDELIQRKIHYTYRLQFLKDVVLARALDDSTFNVLNSCIIFNQIDIITYVQQDPTLLNEVVGLYVDESMLSGGGVKPKEDVKIALVDAMNPDAAKLSGETKVNGFQEHGPSSRPTYPTLEDLSEEAVRLRREVVLLIQQLCVMGKNVQLPARMALFRQLVDRGILFAVQWALSLPEKEESSKTMICAAGEIVAVLLDHDLHGVRAHVLKHVAAIERERDAGKKGADKAETVLALLCKMLAGSQDLAIQSQVGDALKVLMEVPQGDSETPLVGPKLLARKDEPGTEKFLDFFYKHCIEILFRPFFTDVPEFKNLTDPLFILSREKTNLYLYLCDLLCNFALQHSFRSHFYILSSNIATRVASLLRTRDKHLRLAALKFFRACLKLNNRNIFNHLLKHDILKPIIDLTIQESRRDNLLSSSCQEYFEHMRRENFKDLIKYCMTNHEMEIRKLAESPLGNARFMSFIRRWEINNEPPPPAEEKSQKPTNARVWPGQVRHIEAEEENYFNADDDEDDEFVPAISSQWARGQAPPSAVNRLKRKRRTTPLSIMKAHRSSPSLSPTRGTSLVDYNDDDDDVRDSGVAGDDSAPFLRSLSPSSAKIASRTPLMPSVSITSNPKLAHRQTSASPPPRPSSSSSSSTDDDEDNMLESLVRSKPSRTSLAMSSKLGMGASRASEKRRRDEEDEGLLEHLVKSKKPDLGFEKPRVGTGGRVGSAKSGDDPPKKIKLKFGATSFSLASPSPSPSEPGAKDGDTG